MEIRCIRFFTVFFVFFFALVSGANNIIEEKFTFGDSTDIRLTVTAVHETDLTSQDLIILESFVDASNNNQVGVISVTNQNLPFILKELNGVHYNFECEVRDYNGQPWILNSKAIKTMPKLMNNAIHTVQTVLTIELQKNDIRTVFVKDNKAFATNVGGAEEQADISDDPEQSHMNAAIRELSEEVGLSDICRNKLKKIGALQSLGKKPLLKLEWKEYINVYSCHLDVPETEQWLTKMDFKVNEGSELVQSYSVVNEELQWVFIAKPEIFNNTEISLPFDAGKNAKLPLHHADYAAVVLNGKFNKEVLVGRGVSYLNGKIQVGDSIVLFGKQ